MATKPEAVDWERPKPEELKPEIFPELTSMSAAPFYKFIPRPRIFKNPEFVHIPLNHGSHAACVKRELTVSEWNMCWEAGHLRPEFIPQVAERHFDQSLSWLKQYEDVNLYLLPTFKSHPLHVFQPLYQLLPLRTLKKFVLPPTRRGHWPAHTFLNQALKGVPEQRLQNALAYHLWPLLYPNGRMRSFSSTEPIMLLAHNLNFWLPYVYQVAESRLREFPRVRFDGEQQKREIQLLQKKLPADMRADRPLCGGSIWLGEEEAWAATKEMVDVADKSGNLRAILDLIKSHRVEDDFSARWSYAKEDFERKLYHKRSKVKVTFVELDKVVPVHAPTSEVHENLLWEDFLALLDMKERRIVVCLKNGITRASEISKHLGYANHSPVSKALKRIRLKAKEYLDL